MEKRIFLGLLLTFVGCNGHVLAQQTACTVQNDTLQFGFILQIESVDFDGDLDLDLVIEEFSIDELIFLENDGQGNFTVISSLPVSDRIEFRLADLDGDSDLDVVTSIGLPNPDQLAVYINNGDLDFAPPVFYDYTADTVDARGPRLGDFDGDGDVDVCVHTIDTAFGVTPQTLDLFVNDGTGVLTAGEIIPVPSRPSGFEFVDVDNDLDLDLVVSGFDGTNRVLFVYLNDGNGNYSAPTEFPAGIWAIETNVGDINNDSNIDIVLASSQTVGILFGNGDGTFQPTTVITDAGDLHRSQVGILDLTGDSGKELITIRGITNDFNLYINNGPSTFDLDLAVSYSFSPNSVAVGDFDGDGQEDAAIGHSSGALEILFFNCDQALLGDINLDGSVNLLDVGPFVTLLSNGNFQIEADINRDNQVNLLDVAGFVEVLQGS